MFDRPGSALGGQKYWLILAALILLAADVMLGLAYGWQLAAAVLLAMVGWSAAGWFRARSKAAALALEHAQAERETADRNLAGVQERLLQADRQRAEEARRSDTLLRLNRGLVEAQDEHALMDTALSAITGLVGALGCSFVPVDEWDQPLPAFTYGQMPEPVLRAWSAHLATGMLRDRCANCSVLESMPGGCPLHPEPVGDALTVYCLPLSGTKESSPRKLGVLHLYLPFGRPLDPSMRKFLDSLLIEIATAYETFRIRSQEISTLRQLQMLHAPENDLAASLGSLLDGLKSALDASCVLVRLRASADERLSNLTVQRGDPCGLAPAEIDAIFAQVAVGEQAASEPGALPVWMALPLTLPDCEPQNGRLPITGMMLASSTHPQTFHPRQQAILQTVAAQAALLAENERMIRSLEYKVVIQERTRLAREIHDGLAQTLAFLKLQSAQMQTYLAQGDTARLSQVLKDNYHALAEAYLDTRQAIDNLRVTPQEGLERWIERAMSEFEAASGLHIEQMIEPLTRKISPEVQAQLIRIVQEALSNIRKHARANRAWLKLREWQDVLLLEVGDDGQGFDAEDVPEVSRHGLRGMRERAEMIGADFQIVSQAHQGTRVLLSLPLPLEEETIQ